MRTTLSGPSLRIMWERTFTLIPPVRCAFCGVLISWRYPIPSRHTSEVEIDCPSCGCELAVRHRHVMALTAVSFGAAVCVAYVAGLRGKLLWVGPAVFATRLGGFVGTLLSMRLFPPEVQLRCDFRRILYSPDPREPSHPSDPEVLDSHKTDPVRGPADA
jgi:prepilin signal peptidase PulO-like enzyme (type II secretory pathway)